MEATRHRRVTNLLIVSRHLRISVGITIVVNGDMKTVYSRGGRRDSVKSAQPFLSTIVFIIYIDDGGGSSEGQRVLFPLSYR